MSKAPGLPLQRKWKTSGTGRKADGQKGQKAKVVSQLGVITDGEYYIKTCLSQGLILNEYQILKDIDRGSYQCAKDYDKAQVFAFIQLRPDLIFGYAATTSPLTGLTRTVR